MSTSMLRVPDDLKEKLETLKETFYTKTTYEVIDKLISTGERQKLKINELETERENEKQRRQAEDVYLGEDLKQRFTDFSASIGLRSPAAAFEFLLEHYSNSNMVDKATFDLYRRLKA